MNVRIKIAPLIMVLMVIFSSCSLTRTLEEGELLYTETEIKLKETKFYEEIGLKNDLKEVTVPEPNDEFLGIIPFKLWMYNLAGDSVPEKGFRNWLKYKAGQEPVMYNNYHKENSINNISTLLFNKGFFESEVRAEEKINGKKIKVSYIAELNQRYTIDTFIYETKDTTPPVPFNNYQKESLVKKNDPYNLEVLRKERKRIAKDLRNVGYYYFTENNLIFKIDSNRVDKNIRLFLALKENIPDRDLKKYRISKIKVYPDYDISTEDPEYDSAMIDDIIFYSNLNRIDRDIINRSIILRKGEYFSTNKYSATLNKLMGLGIFKYANITYNRDTLSIPDTANFLSMNIYLTQVIPVSLRAEIQAVTKSNNYSGPYFYLTYIDRNAFGGAERFETNINGGFETQLAKQNNLFSYEAGADMSLAFPRFIFPFINFNKYLAKNYTPRTEMVAGYNLLSRVNYFTSNSFDASYGYNWQETKEKYHNLKLFSLNYSNLIKTTAEFEEILNENPLVKESFDKKLIFSLIYDYTYDQKQKDEGKFNIYFNFNGEVAGNTLKLGDRIVHGFGEEAETGQILGIRYSQFAKATFDVRFSYTIDENMQLVNRYIFGTGFPYGNSNTLPYNKQYFIGGANSLRGFPFRSIGPGSFNPRDKARFLFSHNGNIKLESNIEWRFPIAGPVNGALFADAGNVWLWNEIENKRGSEDFRLSQFYNQIAFNTGFGIRLDISFFVLRLDLGIPLRLPHEKNGSHWIEFKPFNKNWISEYPVLNFAIGYPF